MNTRQTKKVVKRLLDNNLDINLRIFYLRKNFAKCYIRYARKRCQELNIKEEEKGSYVRYAPYIMVDAQTVGFVSEKKGISTRYAHTCVNPKYYFTIVNYDK